jgi:hypothetical protein
LVGLPRTWRAQLHHLTVLRTCGASSGVGGKLQPSALTAPVLCGNGVARVELSGPDGGSIAIEEYTAASPLTKRFDEVMARREEERRELEALGLDPDADEVFEEEVVDE